MNYILKEDILQTKIDIFNFYTLNNKKTGTLLFLLFKNKGCVIIVYK